VSKTYCRLCTDYIEVDDLEQAIAPRGYPIGKVCPSCMTMLQFMFHDACEKTRGERLRQIGKAAPAGHKGWLKPSAIKKMTECHSDSLTVVPIMLWFKGDEHAKIGRYICTQHTKEFREDGCPSKVTPALWRPMPDVPKGRVR